MLKIKINKDESLTVEYVVEYVEDVIYDVKPNILFGKGDVLNGPTDFEIMKKMFDKGGIKYTSARHLDHCHIIHKTDNTITFYNFNTEGDFKQILTYKRTTLRRKDNESCK